MRQLAGNLIRDRAHDRKQQTPANNHSSDPKCVRVPRRRVETCCNWFDFSSTRRSSQHKANERCLRISLGILREWQKQGRRKSETTTLQPPSLSTVPVHRKHANNSKHNRLRRAIFARIRMGGQSKLGEADFGDSGSLLLSSGEHVRTGARGALGDDEQREETAVAA